MPFDCVVLSTNDDPRYFQCVPIVIKAWRKWFPKVEILLAYTGKEEMLPYLNQFAPVSYYKPLDGVPTGNWAKVIRYLLASKQGSKVCLVHDIDSIPLQSEYYINLIAPRAAGYLACVGWEVYAMTEHHGKFPAGCMCAEGAVFAEIFNGDGRVGNIFDHKEALDSKEFSDESMVRALLAQWKQPRMQFIPRAFCPQKDCIDRSWWDIDTEKLHSGKYVECNIMRPPALHWEYVKPVAEYIWGGFVPLEEALLFDI